MFLSRWCLFESILRRIRLSLFCRPAALPIHIPARLRSAQIGRGSGALNSLAMGSTTRRDVDNAEEVIPVVILNWNGENDTIECLKSIRKSVPAGFVPVVIDNGSKPENVERLKQECSLIFSRILFLRGS